MYGILVVKTGETIFIGTGPMQTRYPKVNHATNYTTYKDATIIGLYKMI